MDTNGHELILKEEVYEIVGCAMEVLNDLIAYGKLVVVYLRVIERITDHELGQSRKVIPYFRKCRKLINARKRAALTS